MRMQKIGVKRSLSDRVILFVGFSLLALFTVSILVPLAYVVILGGLQKSIRGCHDMERIRKLLLLLCDGDRDIGIRHASCGLSDVKKRSGREKVLQCPLPDHDVLRRRSDSHLYIDEPASPGKYDLGTSPAGGLQCLEYDPGKNLLSVNFQGIMGSSTD